MDPDKEPEEETKDESPPPLLIHVEDVVDTSEHIGGG